MRNTLKLASTAVLQSLDQLTPHKDGRHPVQQARQKFFVAARLAVGLCVLAAGPALLYLHGLPSLQHAAQYTLALTPLASIVILKTTGSLRLAQDLSICGWLALAVSVSATTAGQEAVSLSLLTIALIEAALTMDIVMVAGVIGLTLTLIVVGAASPNYMTEEALALRANVAMSVTPLMIYMAALAAGAILVEHARARADRRNARDLRLLTDAIGDIVVHFDRTGAVSSIVGDTHKAYGLETRDLLGRGFFYRVHVADRPAFLKLVSDAVSGGAPAHAVLRLHVGASQNASGYIEPVFNFFDARTCHVETKDLDENGAPVVCILRDITATKRAEEEIAAARRESELAMASKTRFLANVSHELRTPLNAIIGFSEMLGSKDLEPQDPEKRREYARIIRDSGNHLHEVVNSILDMSKIESGSMQIFPEPFSMPALVEQCCDMIQIKADHGQVGLLREYPLDMSELVADKRACKQILINLLSNAVKFTPPNGTVTVRLWIEGNNLAVSVADTGIGIAPPDLARLGDPFFQASATHDRAYEGTGLGLSVVRGLVGLHGGAIAVESALKLGTTVTVRLPVDGQRNPERTTGGTKIQVMARHGVGAPGQDVSHERAVSQAVGHKQEMVKKIA
ncbi:PAS domain-containing sensor histidine kinase [Methylocystis heyeri]|uniref:PAS domain-containing sensor histidine kinase n=1 Tax=Methylocystis heyeri TaxID=391905 RepID=UPI00113B57F6|nr:HAMP domain-containing sensor histidine kinase [Methylocystis heyeri]